MRIRYIWIFRKVYERTYNFAFDLSVMLARIAAVSRAQACGAERALPFECLLVGLSGVRTHGALSYRHASVEVLRALQLCTIIWVFVEPCHTALLYNHVLAQGHL